MIFKSFSMGESYIENIGDIEILRFLEFPTKYKNV